MKESVSLEKLKGLLQLKFESQLTHRQIGACLNLSPGTISDYLQRLKELNVGKASELDEVVLQKVRACVHKPTQPKKTIPDWPTIHTDLKRKGVTLQLLYEEYEKKIGDPKACLSYSRFCKRYNKWRKKQAPPSMRQVHRAGEKTFIDYSGMTVPLMDAETGEIQQAEIFIAVLGASNFTFAEATLTQNLHDWVGSHVRMCHYFQGVTKAWICDNLLSGVTKACRYEPELNATYEDCAKHYNTVVVPARPYKPRDKPKAEGGVLIAQRWILARLREQKFFSLVELNNAIKPLLEKLNDHPFQKLEGTRRTHFEEIDKPALTPLPDTPYVFATFKNVGVSMDYHVEVEKHFYSVPYKLLGEHLKARITAYTLELFYRDERVAVHKRSFLKGQHSTLDEHRAPAHRAYHEWSPQRFLHWARSIGLATEKFIEALLAQRKYPEHMYRRCLGVLRLERVYSKERVEAACARALTVNALSYKSVQSILKNGLDKQPLQVTPAKPAFKKTSDTYVRGSDFFESTVSSTLEDSDEEECFINPTEEEEEPC